MFHRQAQPQQPSENKAEDNKKETQQGWTKTNTTANTNSNEEGKTMAQDNRNADIPTGAFTPGRPGAGRFDAPASQSAKSRQLLIGSGITMSGEITSCDHLVVEGHVEAELKGAEVLDVAESGSFNGEVEIENATIAGRFEGDITVTGRLTVKSTGFISGNIYYGELAVEAGATLQGSLAPASDKSASSKPKKSEKSETKVTEKSTSETSTQKSGSELPFAASAA